MLLNNFIVKQSLKTLFLALILVQLAQCVDRGAFKTCSQSGFCKRQRDYKPEASPYSLLADSTGILNDDTFTANVINSEENVLFKLELSYLTDNSLRFRLNELNPLKQRYEAPEALVGEPKKTKINIVKKDTSQIHLASVTDKNLKTIITTNPLKFEFFSSDVLITSINSKNLLKFEHLRTKPNQNENETKVEEPDMWEETFKTHTDTKPNGPESIGVDITFHNFENVYGIPEHADTFSLKSTANTDPYRLFNLDVFEYELYNPMALYGSVPYMLAHNDKTTVGLFWPNPAESWIDVRPSFSDKVSEFITKSSETPTIETHWMFESGVIDIFILFGPKPTDVFRQYGQLTGNTPLPPLFSIAYHQCRWNYNDDQDVRNVNAGFEEHQIPYDVLWLDIEHTDGKRYFTWDSIKFPDSVDTINHISSYGRKMVTIIDPHIKVDTNYFIYKEAKEKSYFIKDKSGNDMEGWCWPGQSSWLDFLNVDVRKWYASKFALTEYQGSTLDLYTWNDMNEMSVFSGPEVTCPKDTVHHGGWENRHVHNIYGMLQALSTYDGHLMRSDGKRRPFILSRAFFIGSQRAGAIWTGDNIAEWSHLKISVPMLLTLSVTGISHSGADVGGFFKNPDAELLVRWYQAGAYQPFFRAHAHIDTKRREPWLFDEQTKNLIRDAVHARYNLLYYWYTLFYLNEKSGVPPMLPLWANYPNDKSVFAMDDQYMIGSALLVKPVTEAGVTSMDIYFPGEGEIWYDIERFKTYPGGKQSTLSDITLATIPVFHRGGSIVPYKFRVRRASSQMDDDPFSLVVALNSNGTAAGQVYYDDAMSFDYREKQYVHRQITYDKNILRSINLNPENKFTSKAWLERVVIFGYPNKPKTIKIETSGETTGLEFSYDKDTKVLLIRKPGALMSNDWTLIVS